MQADRNTGNGRDVHILAIDAPFERSFRDVELFDELLLRRWRLRRICKLLSVFITSLMDFSA